MALEKNQKIALGLAVVATVGAGIAAWFYTNSESQPETEITAPLLKKETVSASIQNQVNQTSMVSKMTESETTIVKEEVKTAPKQENMVSKEAAPEEAKSSRLLNYLKQRASLEKHQPNLSMKFIMEVNEGLIEMVAPEYSKVTRTCRDNRRKVRTLETVQEYTEHVLHYTQETER